MSHSEDLKPASFRGAPFFYLSTNGEDLGFKTALHVFPGSDNFELEQLGRVPRRIPLDIRTTADQVERFNIAVTTPGSGRLSHPEFGNLIVKVGGVSRTTNINRLNFFEYSVEFFVEVGPLIPSISGVAASVISRAESVVFENVKDFVNDNVRPNVGGLIPDL